MPGTVEIIRAWIAAGAPEDGRVPGDDGRDLGGGGENPGEISLPPPARGVQLSITSRPVPVGTEETVCHYLKLPSDVDFDVDRIQIAVTGGSHHIHLYRPYDSSLDVPDGFEQCNKAVDFDKWALVVATQLRKTDWELPEGVAFHFRAGEQLLVQTHFVNVGSLETIGEGKVLMNLNAADDGTITDYAGALFGQDRDVDVPPLSNITPARDLHVPKPDHDLCRRPGTITSAASVSALIAGTSGTAQRGEEIYHHEGYADPQVRNVRPSRRAVLRFRTGPGMGVLLGEPDRQRVQVRAVYRHQRALQPVRLLLSDRSR